MKTSTAILFSSIVAGVVSVYLEVKSPEIQFVDKVIEITKEEPNFDEALTAKARAYGVPLELAFCMKQEESKGEKNPMLAVKYEEGQLARAKKVTGTSGEQLKAYATSYCPLQVMGYNAADKGYTWADLLKVDVCTELGMHYASKCLERHKGKDPLNRMFQAMVCYNGGEAHAKKVMNCLGQRLLTQYGEQELRV